MEKTRQRFHSRMYYELLYETKHAAVVQSLLAGIENNTLFIEQYFKNQPRDTTTVFKTSIEGKSYVIKRYNFRNLKHRVKLQLRTSHAYRSYQYAHYLKEIGVRTIEPIAVIQKKKACFKLESYFISRYEVGIPGCVYFNDDSLHKATWPQTLIQISKMTEQLKQHQISHGDYHFGNFLIVNTTPLLLDYDRIQQISSENKFKKLHQKDIANFKRYLERNANASAEFQKISGSR